MRETDGPRHDLVLVGGGHAHVQLLRRFAMRPLPETRLTLVVDDPVAVYSGMVPGFVAGQYARHELEIDVRPLARRADARVIVARATGVDPRAQRLALESRPAIAYDTASFDVGSLVAGLALPGVRAHALATRPIGRFVAQIDALLEQARGRRQLRVVVVGAGAGGVELAFALRARLTGEGVMDAQLVLIDAAERVVSGLPERVGVRVASALAARDIAIRCPARVAAVSGDAVELEGGERLACDALVWAAGAASQPLFRESGLPTDAEGFVRVGPTLQVEGHDALFAAGDCARFEPPLPKAGVYAVRQGPVLAHNLAARIAGRPLRAYRPQRDFLALLNLGDDTALGTKWGRSVSGRFVFRWKDRIDRRFVERFQVLAPDDRPAPGFPPMPGADEMACGGCAAKLGETTLQRALGRIGVTPDPSVVLGLATPDDAAAVRTPGGELVVASVDGFRAFTDDPWLVGRVAAVNALSDLHAKGATPRFALAQVSVPDADPARAEETLYQTLAGARAALDAENVTLVGGHTTAGDELQVGFAVWGHPESGDDEGAAHLPNRALLRLDGLQADDQLILTKALGTGVLFAADMQGRARGAWIEAAVASMCRSNAAAARVARRFGATACTDVSGFGLAGHLAAMLRASEQHARLALEELPLLPGAAACLALGLRSSFHAENARARRALAVEPGLDGSPAFEALFDPQTAGGLLIGLPAMHTDAALAALHAAGDADARAIGRIESAAGDAPRVAVGDRL